MDYSAAAIAIRDALLLDTGRVKSVPFWKKTAANALGISKVFQSRWDAVLEEGEALSLFRVDSTSYSYAVLKLIVVVPTEPDEEDDLEDFDDEEEPEEGPKEADLLISSVLPDDFDPPSFMDCGHLEWWLSSNGACEGCESRTAPNYRYLAGTFIRPIPKGHRRGPHRPTQGFPGLCTDTDGFYIGGQFNDCKRTGDVRCTEHT